MASDGLTPEREAQLHELAARVEANGMGTGDKKTLTRTRGALREALVALHVTHHERDALRGEAAVLREALKSIEWARDVSAPWDETQMGCPSCESSMKTGKHADGCAVGRALATTPRSALAQAVIEKALGVKAWLKTFGMTMLPAEKPWCDFIAAVDALDAQEKGGET